MKWIKEFFYFSKTERNGIFFLMVLIFLIIGVQFGFWFKYNWHQIPKVLSIHSEILYENKQSDFSLKPPKPKKYSFKNNKTDRKVDYYKNKDYAKKKYDTLRSFKSEVFTKHPIRIDINESTSQQWQKIYGIGPVIASRIIKYRELLGGFHSPSQIREVYGIDSALYHSFDSNIYVKNVQLVKIGVDTASFNTLFKHPYIDYQLTISLLGLQRKKHWSIDSLKFLVDEDLNTKLAPYLE